MSSKEFHFELNVAAGHSILKTKPVDTFYFVSNKVFLFIIFYNALLKTFNWLCLYLNYFEVYKIWSSLYIHEQIIKQYC